MYLCCWQGETGPVGATGPSGPQGSRGEPGPNGAVGPVGPSVSIQGCFHQGHSPVTCNTVSVISLLVDSESYNLVMILGKIGVMLTWSVENVFSLNKMTWLCFLGLSLQGNPGANGLNGAKGAAVSIWLEPKVHTNFQGRTKLSLFWYGLI